MSLVSPAFGKRIKYWNINCWVGLSLPTFTFLREEDESTHFPTSITNGSQLLACFCQSLKQRVRHDWATELNWKFLRVKIIISNDSSYCNQVSLWITLESGVCPFQSPLSFVDRYVLCFYKSASSSRKFTGRTFFFNWSIVDFQCVNFFCAAYVFFFYFFPYGLSQDVEYSSLCCTAGSCLSSTSHLLTPNSHSISLSFLSRPWQQQSLFSMSVSLFSFCRWVPLYNILYSTYKWYCVVFVFLFLTPLSIIISGSIHVAANGIISFFLWLSSIPLCIRFTSLCICTTCSSFIYLLMNIGTPLQYSCLENPMDGGAWWAAVHGVAKSRTRLSNFTFTLHFHALEKEMATHSSVLAWRIPGTGEPGGLSSLGSHRVGYDWSDLAVAAAEHLVCFQVLAVVNSAAVNIAVHVSF